MLGSYRIVERLGSGGMCTVVRAIHEPTGNVVALKVMPTQIASNPMALHRFLNEARSLANLDFPNIVAVYDRGFDQGRHYLVTEFLDGGDLNVRVRLRGPLSLEETLNVAKATAKALRFASERGLIHRDLKPANLLFSSQGEVKLADLGLAVQYEIDDRVTREGTTVGTVDFISPEQARDSRAATIRSDIYSLGCTLYFLLTGSPPFAGKSLTEKLRAHVLLPPPDVRTLRPEIPQALAEILLRMMQKRPEDRFADYDELLAALDRVRAEEPTLTAEIVEDDDDLSGSSSLLFDPTPNPRANPGPGLEGISLDELLQEESAPPTQTRHLPRPTTFARRRRAGGQYRSPLAEVGSIFEEPWIVTAIMIGAVAVVLVIFLIVKVIAPVPDMPADGDGPNPIAASREE
jgi:serine/threonine protein kinase